MDALLDWGIDVVVWFQQASPHLDSLFEFLTFLGDEEFYLILLPLVYWSIDRRFGVRLTIVALFSAVVNTAAKEVLAQPRPFEYSSDVGQLVAAGGYGLPSGHTQSAVVIWGFVAVEGRRRWLWGTAALLATGIALSRIYLGVHFPTDVVGGLLIGALILFGWYRYGEDLTERVGRLPLRHQLWLAVVPALTAMALWSSPSMVTAAATFMGMAVGFVLERRYVRFDSTGPLHLRAGRYLAGGALLVGLYFGMRTAFTDLDPALVFRLLRYAIVGLWGALGAPWLFVTIGLATRED